MDGKTLADQRLDDLTSTIRQGSLSPRLHVILVGEDEASLRYIRQKQKSAEAIGMNAEIHTFPEQIGSRKLKDFIQDLNHGSHVDGIIIQLPLPDPYSERSILSAVDPRLDVDGLHPDNFGRLLGGGEPRYYPPTPLGIMQLLEHYEVECKGLRAVLVGMGRLVGRPLSQMLLNRDATVVCLNKETRNLREWTRRGELLVAGAGVPELIGGEDVRPGSVVIDAGIHSTEQGLVGDVNFEEAGEVARLITPVPGGVGPLTVANLLKNTVESARNDG